MGLTVDEILAAHKRKKTKPTSKPAAKPKPSKSSPPLVLDTTATDTPESTVDIALLSVSAAQSRPTLAHEDLRAVILKARNSQEELIARAAEVDPYVFGVLATKTMDEQADVDVDPFRPFPAKLYIELALAFMSYPVKRSTVKMIWKSRTMMMSWALALHSVHYAMTHPATRVVFQSQDEFRAVKLVEKCKILWENALERLRYRWALSRKIESQAYNQFEAANKSSFIALVGDPDKVRSEHPTMYGGDETAFMKELAACISQATAAKTPHIYCVSSSELGYMNDKIEESEEISMANLRAWMLGLRQRRANLLGPTITISPDPSETQPPVRTPADGYKLALDNSRVISIPISLHTDGPIDASLSANKYDRLCMGTTLLLNRHHGYYALKLHYTADPAMRPENISQEKMDDLKRQFPSEALWKKEMEMEPRAVLGSRIYPTFDRSIHTIDPSHIPPDLCVYMATDPHPRTPHAHLWIGVDKWDDLYIFREYWPSVSYGVLQRVGDNKQENYLPIYKYVEEIAKLEGNSISWQWARGNDTPTIGVYAQKQQGEIVIKRWMDQAGKGFLASGEEASKKESFAGRYKRYGLSYRDPNKSHQAGEDAIREALEVTRHEFATGGKKPRLMVSTDCPETILQLLNIRYKKSSNNPDSDDLNQQQTDFRTHQVDLVRYILARRPTYVPEMVSRVKGLGMAWKIKMDNAKMKGPKVA